MQPTSQQAQLIFLEIDLSSLRHNKEFNQMPLNLFETDWWISSNNSSSSSEAGLIMWIGSRVNAIDSGSPVSPNSQP